ncbi:unnamed protein product [Prunus brigantina]
MSSPPTRPSAAIAPARMDHMLVGHRTGSPAPASSASSVAQPVSAGPKKNTRGPCRQLKTAKVTRVTNSRINIGYDERHRAATTAELHSSLAHDIGHVIRAHCPMKWKSWKVMPDETRMEVRGRLSANYNLEDLNEESLTYVNRLLGERYKQWKSDLHHHFRTFDDPETTMVEKSQLVLQESASQLPPDTPLESVDPPHDAGFQILTETLDQTLGRRPGTYCRGMGNARRRESRARSASQSNSQVTALTAEVAELRTQMSQMSQILQSIVQSGVPIPNVGPSSTSEPLQPDLRHPTTAPIDTVQTSEPHLQDDHVDFHTLFD